MHRPRHFGPQVPDSADDRMQEFVLTGELPTAHPLFNDGHDRFHDMQAAMAMVRHVSGGIGQAHFGVAADRVAIFYRFGLETGDVGAWRRHSGPGTLTATLRVRPDKVISGIPRALEFDTHLEIDGVAAGTGSANLLFLAPMAHRSHREHSRHSALAAAGQQHPGAGGEDTPEGAPGPAPSEVGRASAANVLLRSPVTVNEHRLSAAVAPPDTWPTALTRQDGTPSSVLLLEVLRQTALLTAHRLHGLDPRHSSPIALHTHFRGHAEPDLPLRCVAVAQAARQDTVGRPLVTLTLALTQAGRAVTEATVSVVEDL
ncbi:AfsA-related hotdog domain-containing protein [Streptomyces cavernae]|uniref:AfsA-related hotdog domain-containing protein n=1 Tax=Streptomyces cavernae TaxID=2259034 RepID=UPI000FEC1457|nr:AfsA-related hotdog domain-containing protein [Streptomyces cavernae]